MTGLESLSKADLVDIRTDIDHLILKTPCIYSESLSLKYGQPIYLKMENLQKTGAFKIRGNSYKIKNMAYDEIKNGVVTASSGNHGQGLALAAEINKVDAKVFVPDKTPEVKIKKIKSYGAEIEIKGRTYDEAVGYAVKFAEENNYTYIPSFDDPDIIKGNTTLGLEIFCDVESPSLVVVPIGGGGGISGISIARNCMSQDTKIYGVEASGASSMKISIANNKLTELENINTLADGIKVAKPGKLTFEIARKNVSKIVTVSEEEMKAAFKEILTGSKVLAELAGTSAVAALDKIDLSKFDGPIVCVITGGNIDENLVRELL